MNTEPAELTAIRLRAEAPIPRHRLTQADKDRRTLIGIVDRLQLDLMQTRNAKAAASTTNHIRRDDCTRGAA